MATPRTRQRTGSSRPVPPPVTEKTAADIARRAYELFLARGSADGHDLEDWLEAERQLHAGSNGSRDVK